MGEGIEVAAHRGRLFEGRIEERILTSSGIREVAAVRKICMYRPLQERKKGAGCLLDKHLCSQPAVDRYMICIIVCICMYLYVSYSYVVLYCEGEYDSYIRIYSLIIYYILPFSKEVRSDHHESLGVGMSVVCAALRNQIRPQHNGKKK